MLVSGRSLEQQGAKNGVKLNKRGNVLGRERLSSIIMELIYLADDMRKNGHIDHYTLKNLDQTIADLKYYRQFE